MHIGVRMVLSSIRREASRSLYDYDPRRGPHEEHVPGGLETQILFVLRRRGIRVLQCRLGVR